MSLQGRILGGRYTLGPVLGAGGMANVYQATDLVLRRTVAVKVLHFPYDQDAAFVGRFRREARTAAGLSHPNVVAVFDTGTDDDLHYIVMEYVDGENLAELLDRKGTLPPATAAQIGWSVCQALTAAHERGLVHRDIKPGNVIVSRAGEVKVTDFGIAKALAPTAASLTGSGPVLGTASYMSPEQAQGQPVDERSDLYSLGCVLYELLTGEPPFVNDTAIGLVWQHVTEDPEPLAGRHPDVGEGLAAVVGKAIAKQPADRYQTARAMGEDLERVVAGVAPAGTRGPRADAAAAAGAATSPRRLGRAGWALLTGAVLVTLALLAVLAALPRGEGSPTAERVAGAGVAEPPPTTSPPATTAPATTPTPPTTTTGTTRVSSTTPTRTTPPSSSKPPAPTPPSLPAALASLTEVLTAGVMAGTVDRHAYDDLVHKAQDVVRAIQDRHYDDARKKLRELDQMTDGLIANGEIAPEAADRVRLAVTEFSGAAERSMTASPPSS